MKNTNGTNDFTISGMMRRVDFSGDSGTSEESIPISKKRRILDNQMRVHPALHDNDFKMRASKKDNPAYADSKTVSKKALLDPNPFNRERTEPLGPAENETKFQFDKRCLLKYLEIHGDMIVPQFFQVPWTDDWPQCMWGVRLGRLVDRIRQLHSHKDKRDDLMSIGFLFANQKKVNFLNDWDLTRLALSRYKEINGNLHIIQRFIVPSTPEWPEATWGLKLGHCLKYVQKKNAYAEHRDLLREMGIVFKTSPFPEETTPTYKKIENNERDTVTVGPSDGTGYGFSENINTDVDALSALANRVSPLPQLMPMTMPMPLLPPLTLTVPSTLVSTPMPHPSTLSTPMPQPHPLPLPRSNNTAGLGLTVDVDIGGNPAMNIVSSSSSCHGSGSGSGSGSTEGNDNDTDTENNPSYPSPKVIPICRFE